MAICKILHNISHTFQLLIESSSFSETNMYEFHTFEMIQLYYIKKDLM